MTGGACRRCAAALAEYLARTRGVVAAPGGDNIVICSGFAHGLEMVGRALRATGAGTVAMEEYGHPGHRDIITRQGLNAPLLPLDAGGAVVDAAGDADAVVLTPAHQFPLGMTLAPDRRRSFAEWGGDVIEDDYDGEFRYDRQPVGAMQALAPDRVIYCGTASKSLAPGVRLAWLVVPPSLLDRVTACLTGGPSALDQLTLAEFVTSGAYDRQIRRARLVYRHRRDRLITALDPIGLRVGGIAAGLHVVVDLPDDDGRGPRRRPSRGARSGAERARLVRPRPRRRPGGPGHRLRAAARARLHDGDRPAVRGARLIELVLVVSRLALAGGRQGWQHAIHGRQPAGADPDDRR